MKKAFKFILCLIVQQILTNRIVLAMPTEMINAYDPAELDRLIELYFSNTIPEKPNLHYLPAEGSRVDFDNTFEINLAPPIDESSSQKDTMGFKIEGHAFIDADDSCGGQCRYEE